MKSSLKIINDYKNSVESLFSSEDEFELFFNTPEHWFSFDNSNTDLSPKQFLLYSRKKNRLEILIEFTKSLKNPISY